MSRTIQISGGVVAGLLVAASVLNANPSTVGMALERYEGALVDVCATGSTRERSVALVDLAAIVSPRFEECLDNLKDVRDPYCLKDILRAIDLIGGEHQEAQQLILRGLHAPEPFVQAAAARALDTTISFREVWDRVHAPPIWYVWPDRSPIPVSRLSGVAQASPWHDASWRGLPPQTKALLLARAGSSEALARLRAVYATRPGSNWHYLGLGILAENSSLLDREGLIELLDSPEPDLSVYAAISLAGLGDSALLRTMLQSYSAEVARKAIDGIVENRDLGLAREVCLGPSLGRVRTLCDLRFLPLLEDGDLLSLLSRREPQWQSMFKHIQGELRRRGKALSLDQIEGVAPLPNGIRLDPPSPVSASWSWKETYAAAIACEADPKRLVTIFEEAVRTPDTFGDDFLGPLLRELLRSPSLMTSMPSASALKLRSALWTWYRHQTADDASHRLTPYNRITALQVLALLDSPQDREQRWKQWLETGDPLADWESIVLLCSGDDVFAGTLRSKVIRALRYGDLPNQTAEAIRMNRMVSNDRAKKWSRSHDFHDVPFAPDWAMASSPRLLSIQQDFVDDLAAAIPDGSAERLAAEFLAARFGPGSLEKNRRTGPARRESAIIRSLLAQLARWYCSCCDNPQIPKAAPVSQALLRQLQPLFEKARTARFQAVVNEILNPPTTKSRGSGCVYVIPAPPNGPGFNPDLPAGILLRRCEHDLLPLLRELLAHENLTLRREAQWAIWNMTRDPEIPEGWARELDVAPEEQRAQLLDLLLAAHREKDTGRILEYLGAADPKLRLRALQGVRTFRRISELPRVLEMTGDSDPAVAGSAWGILGSWNVMEVVPLLEELALDIDGKLSDAAASTLKSYHEAIVINRMVARLPALETDAKRLRRLMDILDAQLFSFERVALFHELRKTDPSDARALVDWWGEVGNNCRGHSWIRPAFERMAKRLEHASREEISNGVFSVLDPKFHNIRSSTHPATTLRQWLDGIPDDDIWRLSRGPFVRSGAIGEEALLLIDRRRAERDALESILEWTFTTSSKETVHRALVALTGVDCGDVNRKLTPAARASVEACWYRLGIREGVWP
jgi:HEAT repeat protein